ncbi:hypothetical protein LBMAG42_24630 [Deltaproteobacteria bacterium]|nr:hypothetical protein LBMAG42_24630 [Deltaproteobacteria bacterium]
MVTCSGRFPGEEAEACLSLEERAFLHVLGDIAVIAGAAPPSTAGSVLHLARFAYGRPSLSWRAPEGRDLVPVAWMVVPTSRLAHLAQAGERLARVANASEAEAEAWFAALSAEELRKVVTEAADAVDHTDPVLLYLEADTFTNFDRFNNLMPKSGAPPDPQHLLGRLAGLAASVLATTELGANERRLLFAFFLLRRAGLSPEERNGQQLSPWALSAFFSRKHRQYLEHGGNTPGWPDGLVAQADALGAQKAALRQSHTVYRWINGVTFRKEERWRPRDAGAGAAAKLPAGILKFGEARFGLRADAFGDHDEYFLELVRRIARIGEPSPRSEALGALLETVVRAAMDRLPSHLGMTRGMRDLRHLQDALEEGRYADVCAAPITDGYCAVFANEGSLGFCGREPPAKLLSAVSRRMQFNHWHYTPGHFAADVLPSRRHFYYPPRMSDVAEWSDSQHPGHVFARVRHAMRSSAGLRIAGRTWPGLVDIRLMRSVGQPYTDADLRELDGFTELIRSIAQAVLSLKEHGMCAPTVTGFDRADYERRYPPPGVADGAPSDGASEGHSIGAMILDAFRIHGASSAIVCAESNTAFTLGFVERVAERLAAEVGPGGTIAIHCRSRAEQAILITAGLAAGLLVCPLDPGMPDAAMRALIRHVEPDFLATGVSAEGWPQGAAPTRERPVPADPRAGRFSATDASIPIEGGGLVVYTSGATGSPKGVRLSDRQIGENVFFAQAHFGYDATWVSGCLLPLHHTFATISDLLPVLCAGGRVVVTGGFNPTEAGLVAAAFAAYDVRSFSSVPLVLDAWMALNVSLPSTLRFAITGASPLSERTRTRYAERYGHPVVPCYGLTESVCFATASPVGGGKPGAVGRAAGIQIRVLGPDLNPVAVGDHGEIALCGPSVITGGYFRQDVRTEEPFLEEGWFLTGDMGHLDTDGYLYITGRRKNMIIRGGEKVYLEDVDRCLESHPGIAEPVCVQLPGLFGYERAVAFVVAVAEPPDDASIRAHVRERMGPIGGPDEVVWVNRIPRSATGKPLRSALRDRYPEARH